MKKINEIFFRGKWLKKEEFDKKIKSLIEEYSKELKKVSDYNYELLEDKDKYYNLYKVAKETNEEHQVMNGLLRKENDELKQTIKQLRGAKGGLTKQVNKLTKELEEAKKQLEESMTDKYLVRKVRSAKPTKQTMNIKSNSKQSNIIKNLTEEK